MTNKSNAIIHWWKRTIKYTIKIEANKDNANVDYEAELVRIAEWKAKWEEMTGETWKEEKKKEEWMNEKRKSEF